MTYVDMALAVFLVVIFPVLQLRASLRAGRLGELSRTLRALRMAVILGLPLIILAVQWRVTGRSAALLGLGLPLTRTGQIGIAIAVMVIVSLFVMAVASKRTPQRDAMMLGRLTQAGLVSETPFELARLVAQCFLIGCGTELLFRGFLYWFFAPLLGAAGAVVVAALAYGVGHGFRSAGQAVAGVVSAFAFTIAYALTGSLWWLMLVHTAVGLNGAWAGYRIARTV